jgi:hypothetical protein
MRRSMKPLYLTAVLLGVLVAFEAGAAAKLPPSQAHHLRMTLSGEVLGIERATPGGTVLLVGYEHFVRDFKPVYRRVHREGTADADGSLRIAMGRPVAVQSFWVAFDLQTGGHGAVAGSKQALREAELPQNTFKNGSNGKKSKLEMDLDYVYVLTIRPRVGAWEMTAGDGGVSDEDGSLNGKIATGSVRLGKTRHAQSDYDAFEEGDLVATFIPHQMGYLITQVKK